MGKKRDRLEIIKDILETLRVKGGNVKPTHIMYKANLSHQMLTEYTTELLGKKMIEEVHNKKGKKRFELTDKGYKYLKDYSIIRGFVDSYGLE
jgi:predicted transcriptional regulator